MTKITIIDDDQPGYIKFKTLKFTCTGEDEFAEVLVIREKGSDGIVTVNYKTIEFSLAQKEHAEEGIDFQSIKGTLQFDHQETTKSILVKILPRKDRKVRDETFGIQLSNVQPAGAKLSKKDMATVRIVSDSEGNKQKMILLQLLEKVEQEEEISWKDQIIKSCLLYPEVN